MAERCDWNPEANAPAIIDGPRRPIVGTEDFDCPWCGGDCNDAFDDNPVTTCPHCHKEFVCPDENGDLVCVGLLSPADVKYLAVREAQGGNANV